MSNNVIKTWTAQEWSALDLSDDEGEGMPYDEMPFFEEFENFIQTKYQDNTRVTVVLYFEICMDLLKITATHSIKSPMVDKRHLREYFKENVVKVVEKSFLEHQGMKLLHVAFY